MHKPYRDFCTGTNERFTVKTQPLSPEQEKQFVKRLIELYEKETQIRRKS